MPNGWFRIYLKPKDLRYPHYLIPATKPTRLVQGRPVELQPYLLYPTLSNLSALAESKSLSR